MVIKKELSKCCTKCGVEWLEDFSNKQPKRALCIECFLKEGIKNRKATSLYNKEHRIGLHRMEKYEDYKMSRRYPFWKEINKEIKSLTKREDIRAFISKQMDRILEDQQLMDYINDTNLIERKNKKTK